MVSEKKIVFNVLPIESLGELMTPGCSQFEPNGHHWQNLCWVPLNIQALCLVVSGKKIFSCFPIIRSLWQIMTPRGVAYLDPWDMIGRVYKGDY